MIGDRHTLRGPQLYTADDIDQIALVAKEARQVLDELLAGWGVGETTYWLTAVTDILMSYRRRYTPMVAVRNAKGELFDEPCSLSVDDDVAHAKPNKKRLKQGQLATADFMLEINGWHADVADTIVVGGGGHPLLSALDGVWHAGLTEIKPGVAWAEVAAAMAGAAEAHGVRLVRGLAGHGIGLATHELPVLPLVPNQADPPVILRPGMVFTLEPAITTGSGETVDSEDGWAIRTADGAPSAAREVMIAVESDGIRVLGGPGSDDS